MKTTTSDPKSIENWYMKGHYVPSAGTEQFAKFAAHGFSFITNLNKKVGTLSYRVDVKSPSAYCIPNENVIALPGWYFLPEAVAEFAKEGRPNINALTLINGSTIHEALHLKLSRMSPTEVITRVNHLLINKASEEFIALVNNIVEDIFIESFDKLQKFECDWLAAKNNFLFNDELFNKAVATFNPDDAQSIVSFMAFYKRIAVRGDMATILPSDIYYQLTRIESATEPINRVQIVAEIVRMLQSKTDSVPPSAGSGKGDGDGSSSIVDGDELGKSTSVEGATGDEAEMVIEMVESDEEAVGKSAKSFVKEAKKLTSSKSIIEDLDEVKIRLGRLAEELEVVDVMNIVSVPSRNPAEVALSNRFALLLKQMRTTLPTRGRGKEHGGNLDVLRLHNSAIDGKIFSTKTINQSGNNDDVEIILVVDASGSMQRKDDPKIRVSLFDKSLAVAQKAFNALINAKVEAKVFAHTSIGTENYPQLIKIATSKTPNFVRRFEFAVNINLRENLDGIIINEIANNQFTSGSRTAKVLIMLSDGTPQSPNYQNSVGVPHTMTAIANARKNGIKVYSLSLVEGVVDANNRIYGQEYNIDASENLDKEMVKLVTNLVRRK